jgi:hypothetical protein
MSDLAPKADMCSAMRDVRYVPIADIASATIMTMKSAGMTIGEIQGCSKPTHEQQDDDND